jgi:BlaI family transcriptional regulator, penicillinase repressor
MRRHHPTLTPHELAIMKVIWKLDTATVREVYEALREKRSIAYTTVMTMMNVLEEKGYLEKRRVDRAYVYTPTRPQQQVVRQMVTDFVDRVFDGAAAALFVHLAKDNKLSKDERKQIRKLIEEMDK